MRQRRCLNNWQQIKSGREDERAAKEAKKPAAVESVLGAPADPAAAPTSDPGRQATMPLRRQATLLVSCGGSQKRTQTSARLLTATLPAQRVVATLKLRKIIIMVVKELLRRSNIKY